MEKGGKWANIFHIFYSKARGSLVKEMAKKVLKKKFVYIATSTVYYSQKGKIINWHSVFDNKGSNSSPGIFMLNR